MAVQTPISRLRRAPNGMDSAKPVPIRISADERAMAQAHADEEQRSLASMCRIALLRGFEQIELEKRRHRA